MKRKNKVVVAMSGGVDSSLVAALLLEKGYDVSGMTMLLFDEGREGKTSLDSTSDAKKVADFLGISHIFLDLRKEFNREVIEPFIDTYAQGRTPNPCVTCNKKMKFGLFFDMAMKLGSDYLATGHYARIVQEKDGTYSLRKGFSREKDQSYVLYSLRKDTLDKIIFPLGEMEKTEVRELATKFHLPVAKKKESQEICFIPEDDYIKFLISKNPSSFLEGKIVNKEGMLLGRHKGLPRYTIGQRKGLGIASTKPLYVVDIDTNSNQLVVGRAEEVWQKELFIKDTNWLIEVPKEPFQGEVKIRYGKNISLGTIVPLADDTFKIIFDQQVRAITKGQSAVIYEGDRVLGGGIIF